MKMKIKIKIDNKCWGEVDNLITRGWLRFLAGWTFEFNAHGHPRGSRPVRGVAATFQNDKKIS